MLPVPMTAQGTFISPPGRRTAAISTRAWPAGSWSAPGRTTKRGRDRIRRCDYLGRHVGQIGLGEPAARGGDADGGDHRTRVVPDRCGDAAQVGSEFLVVHAVALPADGLQ